MKWTLIQRYPTLFWISLVSFQMLLSCEESSEDLPIVQQPAVWVQPCASVPPLDSVTVLEQTLARPLFIGMPQDSFVLEYNYKAITHKTPYDFRQIKSIFTPSDSSKLDIWVDTSRIIGQLTEEYVTYFGGGTATDTVDYQAHLCQHQTRAYPVIIHYKGSQNDSIAVCRGHVLPLVLEAKDSTGVWQPIQSDFNYFCGTGLRGFYLKTGEQMIASCKLYQGNYRTEMRLRLGANHLSRNTFMGQMNYQQFKPRWLE